MGHLLYFAFAILALGVTITLAIRKSKRDEEAREAQFRAIMLSLEEKAKREGTYVASYFDGENAKRS